MHSLCMAGTSLTALTSLNLARLVNASCMEDAWALRLASFGMLRALDLSGWHRMTDHGLSCLLSVQTALQHLALAHCKKISDVAMSGSLGGLLSLKCAFWPHDRLLVSACLWMGGSADALNITGQGKGL